MSPIAVLTSCQTLIAFPTMCYSMLSSIAVISTITLLISVFVSVFVRPTASMATASPTAGPTAVRVKALDAGVYNLGEGPHWDHKSQSLYFVDAFVGRVIRFNQQTGRTDVLDLKDLVTIVIPFKDSEELLLVSLRNKVIKYDIKNKSHEVIAQISPELEGRERFNDGKVDALGRLWIGSVLDGPDGAVPQSGSLYRLSHNSFRKMSENFTLSNGITWNLNNTKLYFNDSGDRKVYVFDFDLQSGSISKS